MTHYTCALSLHQLTLPVHLGFGAEERKTTQPVIIDITIYFSSMPIAATKDGEGFLCYDALTQHLKTAINNKEFQLIEYLAPYLGNAVEKWLHIHAPKAGIDDCALTLTLLKPEAPVLELKGGASFTYSTLPNGLLHA